MKPVLLVDVDGVLNPSRQSPLVEHSFVEYVLDGFPVLLSATHGEWLRQLSKIYELVWATAWEDQAAELIAPILELPSMPIIELSGDYEPALTWKLPAIAEVVGNAPVAWIDDEIFSDAFQWAKQRSAPTVLIKVDPTVGLTWDHVVTLFQFGASFGR